MFCNRVPSCAVVSAGGGDVDPGADERALLLTAELAHPARTPTSTSAEIAALTDTSKAMSTALTLIDSLPTPASIGPRRRFLNRTGSTGRRAHAAKRLYRLCRAACCRTLMPHSVWTRCDGLHTDAPAVVKQLAPQLPDQLCVIGSRWSRADIDSLCGHLEQRAEHWAVESINESCDERAQATITVKLLRVTREIADWADSQLDGLTNLTPALRPAEQQ